MAAPNILLLIDDPTFRGSLLPALRAVGMGTLLTGDGEHARALIARGGVTLIVVDARIPGAGGLEWVRARRAAGLAIPVILCASSKDEMRSFLELANELHLSSVVSRSVKPEDFAHHIAELISELSVAPPQVSVSEEPDDSEELGQELERFRQALQRLQQDPERRERMESTLAAAKQLRAVALRFASEPSILTAKRSEEILTEALHGRRRMDHAAFSEIERILRRARDAAPSVTVSSRPGAPMTLKKRTSSAHEPGTDPGLRKQDHGLDELTGLPPQAGFIHDAEELIGNAILDGRPISFCAVTFADAEALRRGGHFDRAMQATGRFLAARFRPIDRRGRWSDAAFALAFPGTPPSMAADLLNRTFDAFRSVRVSDDAGARVEVILAGGVAAFPKDGGNVDALMAIAERAASQAGKSGGGVRSR